MLVEAATHFSEEGGEGLLEAEEFTYSGVLISDSDDPNAKDYLLRSRAVRVRLLMRSEPSFRKGSRPPLRSRSMDT